MLVGETIAMIVFRLAAVAAGLTALLVAGLGSDPNRQSPAARVVATLSSTLRPAAPAPRPVVAPTAVAASALAPPRLDLTPVGAIVHVAAAPAPSPAPVAQPTPVAAPAPSPAPPLESATSAPPLNGSALAAAAALYRKGDLPGGDALAAGASDAAESAAYDWLALRVAPHPDDKRLAAFAAAHPHWPGGDWIRAVEEGRLYADHAPSEVVSTRFAGDPPRTPAGKLALARALLESGRRDEATAIVAPLWRNDDLDFVERSGNAQGFRRAAHPRRPQISRRPLALRREERSGVARRGARRAGRSRAR